MTKRIADRILSLRNQRKQNQTEFAESLGVTQGTVARWEGGSVPKAEALARLAAMAGTSVEAFIGNVAPAAIGETIHIAGYVGAGAEVYPVDDHALGDGIDNIERPDFIKGKAIGVEVRGDSLVPVAEDGWRLIYTGDQTIVEDQVLNRLCVVKLADGRMLVKRLMRGSQPLRYHLVSTNAPMIENAEIEWAARVTAIIPR